MKRITPLVPRALGTSYEERVLIAHFAIMTVGLVAWLGAWHESALSFSLLAGALALTTLVLCFLSAYTTGAGDPVQLICLVAVGRPAFATTCDALLRFIRRANLLAGPPTGLVVLGCPQRGGRVARAVAHGAPAPFVILCPGG